MQTEGETKIAQKRSSKWGEAGIAGFQLLPDLLPKYQKQLGLDATDFVVLINLTMHWWYEDVKPFPRPTTIAKRMGISVRTVQRSLAKMQNLGLIAKQKAVNQYDDEITVFDLSGLVKALEKLAVTDSDYMIRKERKVDGIGTETP